MNPYELAAWQWEDDVNHEAARRIARGIPPAEALRQAKDHVASTRRSKARDEDRLTSKATEGEADE